MGKLLFSFLSCGIIGSGIFFSCQKEISCEGCATNTSQSGTNKPPLAIAGPDQVITLPTDSVSLDGSASSDSDGKISEWRWQKISGPASFAISSSTTAKTIVKNLVVGSYLFELMVIDNGGLSARDTVAVRLDSIPGNNQPVNHPPIANAGADQSVILPTNSVNVDGSGSTDPDNNITSYTWSKISGTSAFYIANANRAQTQIANLAEGNYEFELKVTDAGGLFSKDTVWIRVASDTAMNCVMNNLPVIHARLTQIGTLSVPRMPAAGAAGDKVVFAGGWSSINCTPIEWLASLPSSVVDIFNVRTRTWSNAQLSMARGGIRSVSCGTKIFFAGGEDGLSVVYDNVDIYDALNNTWAVGHLSEPRAYAATAAVGNKVLFAGGYFYNSNSHRSFPRGASKTVDIYDLATNQWSVATLSGNVVGLYTATAAFGKVYFSGGNTDGMIDIYDNKTNSWSTSNSEVQWAPIQGMPWPWGQGNPLASFASGENIYWTGIVEEPFETYPDMHETGRTQIKNIATGTVTTQCAPIISSQLAVYRNNEVAFFDSYDGWQCGCWQITEFFDVYNISSGIWSRGVANDDFITSYHDAGIVSANDIIYVGGGTTTAPGCWTVTGKVFILDW